MFSRFSDQYVDKQWMKDAPCKTKDCLPLWQIRRQMSVRISADGIILTFDVSSPVFSASSSLLSFPSYRPLNSPSKFCIWPRFVPPLLSYLLLTTDVSELYLSDIVVKVQFVVRIEICGGYFKGYQLHAQFQTSPCTDSICKHQRRHDRFSWWYVTTIPVGPFVRCTLVKEHCDWST